MTDAHTALVALQAHLLATITQANGYPVTVQSVGTGQDALAVGSLAPLPALTLTVAQDDLPRPPENAGDGTTIEAGQALQYWERTLWLEGFVAAAGDWDRALDELLDAVRRALSTYPGPLKMSGATFGPPETGGPHATLKMALTFHYRADYTAPLY